MFRTWWSWYVFNFKKGLSSVDTALSCTHCTVKCIASKCSNVWRHTSMEILNTLILTLWTRQADKPACRRGVYTRQAGIPAYENVIDLWYVTLRCGYSGQGYSDKSWGVQGSKGLMMSFTYRMATYIAIVNDAEIELGSISAAFWLEHRVYASISATSPPMKAMFRTWIFIYAVTWQNGCGEIGRSVRQRPIILGVPEEICTSLRTTILQPYVTDSCGFQQNVQKEIVYTTKTSVWVRQLNILCFAAGKWTVHKQN